ncbi:MAG TPA: GNAT family N-acetyltransferase [Anaerolineales bacterium]|nr:GNAT family N-acetyltransferase [Anaerolineales bacterium]
MTRQSGSSVDVLIRTAAIDESSAIASVLRQAFIEYESLYTRAAFEATAPAAGQIEERWHEGPVWVALENDNIVGTVAAVPKSLGLYIRSMAVLPGARRQGVAGKLLEEIESFAMDHCHKHLFLSTTPFLHHAIRLYEQFGFVRTSDGPYELHGTPLFTMEKSLRLKAE